MSRPTVFATLTADAVEAGLDDGVGPSTCWRPAIATKRTSGPTQTLNLFAEGGYEALWAAMVDVPIRGVQFNVSWSRLEPRRGDVDATVVDRYRRALRAARDAGLCVDLVAIDQSWPAWLGAEPALVPWTRSVLRGYVTMLADLFRDDVNQFALVASVDRLALGGYRLGLLPPFRRRAQADERAVRAVWASLHDELATELDGRFRSPLPEVSVAGPARALTGDAVALSALLAGSGPYASAAAVLTPSTSGFTPSAQFTPEWRERLASLLV